MIILDQPFVSKQLQNTIIKNNFPVLVNTKPEQFELPEGTNLLNSQALVEAMKNNSNQPVYCNSENSINWILNNLAFTELPKRINLFKDKVAFRKLIRPLYPEFYFEEIAFNDLEKLEVTKLAKPFIIKPSVGFHSTGVYKVHSNEEWPKVLLAIREEIARVKDVYPVEVMNASQFIVEEHIDGDEYAMDVYYNNEGKPVILNILKHIFASEDDVSDRLYITSAAIIKTYHPLFLDMLQKIGEITSLRNFSAHIELRVDSQQRVVPIEVNPMRFAGWCTTDVAGYAYGINTYEYYLNQQEPDWDKIIEEKSGKIYSLIVADIPKHIDREKIESIDYDRFLSLFKRPLEIRKINYKKYPIMAFLFTEADSNDWEEVHKILKVDFADYIKLKQD
jgi:hypothetical protein